MPLSISQIVAASYNAVLTEMRKAANQWNESAFMRECERMNAITRLSLGPVIECPLDWRPNPGQAFLVTDMDPVSLAKTDVLSAATYTPAELSVPIVWSKGDDAKNPTENQKVPLVRSLMENAINSHDDAIEEALFATTTNGFLGLQTLVPDTGLGVVGGIDANTETFWRNYTATYTDGTNIEAAMTTAFNAAAKGSGASLAPKMVVSGAQPQATFEANLQAQQRYIDTDEANKGFKVLAFKTARYVFSQYGNTRIYFLNPKSFQVVCSRQYFRDRGETQEIPDKNAFVTKIYSALQAVTNNKSRLAVLTKVP
jgi:hypothetical protein